MHRGSTTKHQQGGYDLSERRHQEGMYKDPWNRGHEGNWKGYKSDRNRHDKYENYGHSQRGKGHIKNFPEEWPTPWEERMLKRLMHMVWKEASGWGQERQ